MQDRSKKRGSKGPWLWPLALAVIGVLLLLNNFLLLGDFNLLQLWPLLLVVIGAQMLLRGDLAPGEQARTFGITRGSVESATLEVNAGEIDVGIRALRSANQERLIAGQYAVQSRPELRVEDNHAHLRMLRSQTPYLSFADWEMGLARDLPWQLAISTHLGQVNLDLSELVIQDVMVNTGIGDIRLVCPYEAFDALHLYSTLGNLHVVTPPGTRAQITVKTGRFFNVHADSTRYEQVEPGVFVAREAGEEALPVAIHLSGTFGDAYLA